MVRGMTLILHSSFHPIEIWKTISEKQITQMMAVPTLLTFMLQVLKGDVIISNRLRTIYTGGAQLPKEMIQQYEDFGYTIEQVYALTETTCYLTRWGKEYGMNHAGSLGIPSYLCDVVIRDPETLQLLEPNQVGEIVTRGQHVFAGYWNNPTATQEVLQDGWFATRDIGYIDEQGFLYILDRLKDMISTGGEKVYPMQVESVIRGIEGVADVAVIGVPDPIWIEIPRAYVVLHSGVTYTEEEILQQVHQEISAFKLQQVSFINELPQISMGKVLKYTLRDQVLHS